MSAFAAAVDAIFADPNMAADAVWRVQGVGPDTACRVIRAQPDDLTDYGTSRLVTQSHRLDVRISEIPAPEVGDMILIGDERYIVQSKPRADRERLVWSVDARPE